MASNRLSAVVHVAFNIPAFQIALMHLADCTAQSAPEAPAV